MTKEGLIKEIKAIAIIVIIIGISITTILVFQNTDFRDVFVYCLSGYVSLILLLFICGKYIKNRYFNNFKTVVLFPIVIIYALLLITIPFLSLIVHTLLYFGIAFLIPELLSKGLSYFHLIDFITVQTIIYLKITLTVFISVLLNPLLRDIVYRLSPVMLKSSKKLKPLELDKLTDYFLSVQNVRFFVYSFYVVALLTTNYLNFQGQSFSTNAVNDKCILQSFVTFIAFDRALALAKLLDFKPSSLVAKIHKSILKKLDAEAEG
ncbi:MAG: hypothetical protein V4663_13280 [Bacteroidota bacterium]